jgi:hypothetical protein
LEHIRALTRELRTGADAVLHVEARSGAVVVEGRDIDLVRIEAVLHVWSDVPADADDAMALVDRGIEHDGRRAIVRAPSLPQSSGGWGALFGQRGSRVDYTITVPRTTAVRVLSRSGRVHISGTHGVVTTELMSGRCTIEDVRGAVEVASRSGSIHVERISGDVTASARSGRVRVTGVRGDVAVEARSGSIEVADVTGSVRADARSGAVSIDDAGGKVHARSRCGAMRYRGAIRDDIDLEVHTGPIHLAADPSTRFFVDAESHLGDVRSDLPPRRASSPGEGAGPRVRLRAHVGSIRLTRL